MALDKRHILASAGLCAALVNGGTLPVQAAQRTALASRDAHARVWSSFVASLKGKYAGKSLSMIMINDPFVGALSKTADQFAALTGARIKIDQYGYGETYQKEVLNGSQKSSTYDLVVFDVPWMGNFVPFVDALDPYIARTDPALLNYSDFFGVMRQAATWKGKIIGFPFAPYFILQNYNKTIYNKLGLKPARTIDQWVANAAKANKSAAAPGVYGVAMNNQSGDAVGQAYFEYIYNYGGKPFASEYPGSPDSYADMTPLFTSPQSLAVVNLFKKMIAYQAPGALNMEWGKRHAVFATGKVAAINEWDVATPSLVDPTQSTVTNDYALAVPPTNGKLVESVGGWTMGINKYTSQKSMAWDFIKWFTSPETSVQFSLAGGFPPRTSSLSNPQLLAKYPWYTTLSQVVPMAYADFRPRIPESEFIISTLGTYIARALAGSLSVKDAMSQANKAIGSKLKAAGYKVTSM